MVVKISTEQLSNLRELEIDNYINSLHQIIIKQSPSLADDGGVKVHLIDAEQFVNENGFTDKKIKTEFLIMNAYEPGFYKTNTMQNWILNGTESPEREYVKYQQIRSNFLKRNSGVENE